MLSEGWDPASPHTRSLSEAMGYNACTMHDGLCTTCGASWHCDHLPDRERRRLQYVPPDAPTARQIGIEAVRVAGEHIDTGLAARSADRDANVTDRATVLRRFAANIEALSWLRSPARPSAS